MTKEEKQTFAMATIAFRKAGHEYKIRSMPTDTMWLYDTCDKCNSSIYHWATNGQFECGRASECK